MNALELLERPALVLNRHWHAIRTTTVREVIGLVARGSAKIIEPGSYAVHDLLTWHDVSRAKSGEARIRSAHLAIAPPEVVLLTTYEGLAARTVVFSRRNLFKRDRFACQYCGTQPGASELTIDHVIPRSRGGASTWENCVLACVECNKKKGSRTCAEARMIPRKTPVKPSWKALARETLRVRLESWEQFLTRAYWEVELE